MITALLTALALSAGGVPEIAPAGDPRLFAEPSTQTVPSAYACTAETLAQDRPCTFESDAAAAADAARQADANVEAALRVGDALCPRVARHPLDRAPDPDALRLCKKAVAERAGACAGDGAVPLLDAQGRFAPGSRACYLALSEALGRTRTVISSSVTCCRCLAAGRCLPAADRCNEDALSRLLAGAALACAQQSCAEACRSRIPAAAPPAAPERPQAAPQPPPVLLLPAPLGGGAPCLDPYRPEYPCPVLRTY
jgi:hypothetical protein